MKINKIKRYIIGEHIGSPGRYLYWRLPDNISYIYKPDRETADLAIVENMNGVAIVKIVGCAGIFGEFPYGHKKVLQLIVRDGWDINQYRKNSLSF
ncbi:hypothetical protein [Holdemania sp. 1001302B_160321_E10]|uniref:hypothetical protein n=1 Tax=Holdemania sp. 1001302B_160321_E10 TaxID=2787120 RepID=UPI00189B4E07|nr:hypothetical protein [Holdemania sp. 1001302B_160321_E10]